ncbi:MaoC family dehydratase [Candidatus Sumerlaeota bacterium]|nr:MaoC family dehydratase [Candidatus Sumerlaeota bacterium]MBI3736605.1 MaoC family dehydratase [Candidatus Sumerlaeota bacterium]
MREVENIEELKSLIGKEVAVSDWIEVTQERINLFAKATGDDQWIHKDVERCRKESPFGAPIAHGYLTLSLIPYLDKISFRIKQPFKMTINAGINKLRFMMPVVVGSKVRLCKKLIAVASVEGGWRVNWRIRIEIEGQKNPACIAELVMRYVEGDFVTEQE